MTGWPPGAERRGSLVTQTSDQPGSWSPTSTTALLARSPPCVVIASDEPGSPRPGLAGCEQLDRHRALLGPENAQARGCGVLDERGVGVGWVH
ncbi:MAG: hypothetical protein ACRDTD_15900 [Pseudonocardiaceae bacterium]